VTSALETLVAAREHELVAFRRRLHSHPELSYAEHATTEAIADRLQVAGLRPQLLGLGTGLVCDVVGNAPGPIIALRADIDALAMSDGTTTEYRSRVDGVAHACGHDAHTAVVLGAGLALRALTEVEAVPGTIRLIFEPGEESVPGGAVAIIDEGWLAGVSAVLALHCDPKIDVGEVGLRAGALTAASDTATITLRGPGGHTARPHLTVDLVSVMADVVRRFPDEVSQRLGSDDDVVTVFGAIHAGDAPNVIPAQGTLRFSLRCADRGAWARAEGVARESLAAIVAETGAHAEMDYHPGTPPVVNDSWALDLLERGAREVVGARGVVETPRSMGADTFAWYGEVVPAAYARLGTHSGDGPRLDLHASSFDIDERAIGIGARVLAEAALFGLRDATT